MTEKKAILVVSFGTSFRKTREKNIEEIEKEIAQVWPDWEIRRAFTSGMILKVLKDRDGIHIDNVDEAMDRLVQEGFTKIFVQPTHILNGNEYDKMVAQVKPYEARLSWLKIGQPLLSKPEDFQGVCRGIMDSMGSLAEKEVLVLMGHGTEHVADAAYRTLGDQFKSLGYSNVFVGTVEGFPTLEELLPQVAGYAPDKVKLLPFMVVAGDHATNDMAGDHRDSWKMQFEAQGYEVECLLKGLGEIPAIRKLYLDHIDRVMHE